MKKLEKILFHILLKVKLIRYLEHPGPNDDTKRRDIEQMLSLSKWKKNDTINFSANYLVKKKIVTKEKIFNQIKK